MIVVIPALLQWLWGDGVIVVTLAPRRWRNRRHPGAAIAISYPHGDRQ
ncbi:MAG TPA: hypothetical protein VGG60_06390 [Candidatus Binataceae bacterium]